MAPVDFTYEVGDETVQVTPGIDGQQVDTAALLAAVEEALDHLSAELRAGQDIGLHPQLVGPLDPGPYTPLSRPTVSRV